MNPLKRLSQVTLLIALFTLGLSASQQSLDFKKGLYAGFTLGYEFNSGCQTNISDPGGLNVDNEADDNGFITNLFLGYMHIFKNSSIVPMIETLIEYPHADETFVTEIGALPSRETYLTNTKISWSWGLAFRLGYIFDMMAARNMMIYGLAGFKISRLRFLRTITSEEPDPLDNEKLQLRGDEFLYGGIFGAGIEGILGLHRLAVEFAYTIYSEETITGSVISAGTVNQTIKTRPENITVSIRYIVPINFS